MATPSSKLVVSINMDKLVPSPTNPRKEIAVDALKELGASIKARGLIQPIVVRKHPKNGGKFEIVAGERRYRAAKHAGLEQLDAIVRELDDVQVREVQHVENIQREDVTPLDQAVSFAELQKIDPKKYTVDGLAAAFNIGRRSVYTTMQLAKLRPDVQVHLRSGFISPGHALVIAPLSDLHQDTIAKNLSKAAKADEEWMSVREMKRQIAGQILRDLSKQKFPKDDPTLNPAMGPCTTCRFNTTVNPEAFPDEKSDRCMNAPCFEIKVATFVKREADKVAAEAKESGEKVIQIVGKGADWQQERKLQEKGALPTHAYKEVKHNAKGAVKAVVVGGDGAGTTKYVMPTRDENGRVQQRAKTPVERAKRSEEILDQRINALAKRKVWQAVRDGAAKKSTLTNFALKQLAAYAIRRNYDSAGVVKALGIVEDEKNYSKYGRGAKAVLDTFLDKLSTQQLVAVGLYGLAYGHDPFGDRQWMDENFKAILEQLKIEPKDHLADARKEMAPSVAKVKDLKKQAAQTSAQRKKAKGKKGSKAA